MVGAFIPGAIRNNEIVTGAPFGTFSSKPNLVSDISGIGWQYGSYTLPLSMSPVIGPAKVSVIAIVKRVGAYGTYNRVFDCGGDSTSSGGWDIEASSGTSLNFTAWNGGQPTNGTSVVLPQDEVSVLGFSNDSATTRSYLGGALVGSGSAGMSPATIGGKGPIAIGTDRGGGNSSGANIIYGIFVYNRVLSDAEMYSISLNLKQLIAQQPSFPYAALAASSAVLLAAIAEAGSAAEASSIVVVSAPAAVEAGSAADASQATKATVAATSEAGAGADTTAGSSSTAAGGAEVLAAAESIFTGASTSAGMTEAGAASEISGASNAAIASIAETGAATASPSAVAALSAGSADVMSAAEASSTSGAVTSVSMVEAGSAADATSGVQLSVAATNESVAVTDSPAATMATTAGRSDALTAADLLQPGGTIISASVVESGAVADFVLASYMLAAQVNEGASASDWLACSFMGVASISESSPAVDITSGRWITSAALTEALAALALTTAQLGGQLKPNPRMTYVGRPRIRSITGVTRIRSM